MNGTLIEGPPGYKRKGMKLGITGMNIYPAMKKQQQQQNVSASLLMRLSYSKSEQNNSLLKKINCIQYGNCQERQTKVTAFLNKF